MTAFPLRRVLSDSFIISPAKEIRLAKSSTAPAQPYPQPLTSNIMHISTIFVAALAGLASAGPATKRQNTCPEVEAIPRCGVSPGSPLWALGRASNSFLTESQTVLLHRVRWQQPWLRERGLCVHVRPVQRAPGRRRSLRHPELRRGRCPRRPCRRPGRVRCLHRLRAVG